jgi:hypothetical protein
MVNRLRMDGRRVCLGALFGVLAAVGCGRLAGLGDLTDARQPPRSESGGSGGDEMSGGAPPVGIDPPLVGNDTSGADTSGGRTGGGPAVVSPEPLGTCTLGISALDECTLE